MIKNEKQSSVQNQYLQFVKYKKVMLYYVLTIFKPMGSES